MELIQTMTWLPRFLLLSSLSLLVLGEECSEPSRLIFKSPGNVTITGIFDVHGGENCTKPLGKGLEEAAAAAWTISILNQQNYLPGMEIGLYLFDGCNQADEARKTLIEEMMFENCLRDSTTLGTLASTNIKSALDPLTSGLDKKLVSVGKSLQFPSLLKMAVLLLRESSINTIHRFIGDSHFVLQEAGRAFAEDGICVYDQVLITDFHGVNNEVLQPPKNVNENLVSDGPPVIVVIATASRISNLMSSLTTKLVNITDVQWYLLPTDSSPDIDTEFLPPRTYVLSAVVPNILDLQNFLKDEEAAVDPLNHRVPSKSPFFLSIASAILNLLRPIKDVFITQCGNANETCSAVNEYLEMPNNKSKKVLYEEEVLSKEKIIDILTNLKVAPDTEMFLFTVTDLIKNEEMAVFQNYDPVNSVYSPMLLYIQGRRSKRSMVSVNIDDIIRQTSLKASTDATSERKSISGSGKSKSFNEKHPCYEPNGNLSKYCGICLNFVKYLSKIAHEKQMKGGEIEIGWRFEAWVGINASIATIGVLCTLTVFLFISIRICAGDVLEGNPFLSFCLLFAIIITYCSTLPFSFKASGTEGDLTITSIICDLRVMAPPVSYSILFSIIFSRSIMLAACDQDGGFMSHVNGYIQAVVIFFTCAVQIVLSGEYWFFNSFFFNPTLYCQPMYDDYRFILLHSYNTFLLLILLLVTPFMCRSKRNYHEGTFFSIAIIALVLAWITWITLFFLLPPYFNDAIVTLGLTSTATIVLVCVFIPRTYLMTTSIVRDRIVNTLPPLTTDVNFRSTHALYDSVNVNGKVGSSNPNFYSINPAESSPATPKIQSGEYYSSQLKIPSPKRENGRISTKPRVETPEHTYEGYDSPLHNPVNVTRF